MIIAFGGLGGSGKTTQIEELRAIFRNEKVSVLALRGKFLWPRIVRVFSKKKDDGGVQLSLTKNRKKISFARFIYELVRNVFYILDSWRIYFFVIFPLSRKTDLLFIDRYFYDFFVELFYPENVVSTYRKIFLKVIPHAPLYVYFQASPKTVFDRKHEFPEEIISLQKNTYDAVLNCIKKGIVNINGEAKKEEITEALSHLFSKIKDVSLHNFDIHAFVLFEFLNKNSSLLKKNVFLISPRKFLNIAGSHKVLYRTLLEIEKNNIEFIKQQTGFSLALEQGKKKKKQIDASVGWLLNLLKDTKIKVSDVKSNDTVEAHSDLDVVFLEREGYEEFIAKAQKFGGDVKMMNRTKADVFLGDDFAPIDIHCGITFGGATFFNEQLFSYKNGIANALMVVSHAFSETTLIPLGDKMKVFEYLGSGKFDEMLVEAKKFHWEKHLNWWFGEAQNDSIFWTSFPKKIPITRLIMFKTRSYTRAPIKDVVIDIWNTLRAIRGRSMNIVPFHEPWFIF